MSIFIANCTKQNLIHFYRLPETGRHQHVEIASGQQKEVGKGWTEAQKRAVIDHMESVGFRAAPDAGGALSSFSGWIYRIGRPVTEAQIVDAHDDLVESQEMRSAAEASRAALAFDRSTRDKKTGKRSAKTTEVEVLQDIPRNERPTGQEVNFSLSVAEDGRSDVKLPG
ncbi:hypothetical protein [Robbsia andropogonis]|uniref:hypothetical protein n=1 Tax=Robbsia andropogonis TaxID=28092 RepID=UPI002A6A36B1|nr:hypothetical protein [Robbsia andropogonis]